MSTLIIKHEEKFAYSKFMEYVLTDKCVAVELLDSDSRVSSFFVDRVEWDSLIETFDSPFKAATNVVKQYLLPSEELWKEVEAAGLTAPSTSGYIWEEYEKMDTIKLIRRDDFNPNSLIYLGENYNIFKMGQGTPISIAFKSGYLQGGIDNEHFYLKPALEILNKCEYVWDAKIKSIPSYNSEKGCDKYIEFYFKLPQGKFDKIYNYLEAQSGYTGSVQANCVYGVDNDMGDATFDTDVFGLKPAYKNGKG